MASTYSVIICFFTLFFKSVSAVSNSSFSFKNFGQNSSFDPALALYGDAKVVNAGSSVQLIGAGRVTYKNPIKFFGGTPKKLVSFSTYFSFSISPSGSGSRNGDGLAFVVFSDGYSVDSFGHSNGDNFKFLSVEFDTLRNHVGIDISNLVSLKATNLSSLSLGLIKGGDTWQVWVDYESGSRRLEVRMSRFGETRPRDPLLFQHVDLPKIWPENEGFFVGLSSSNGNSSQVCNVYSWSFKTRGSPDWMHSQPLDPIGFKERGGNENWIHKKDDCVMRILSALILGIGLGALGSFVGMFMWTLFAKRRPVSPEEYAVKPVVDSKSFSK